MLLHGALDYINKAGLLADRLGIVGSPAMLSRLHADAENAAWSVPLESLIPAQRAFDRIKTSTAPTVTEVEQALRLMEIQGMAAATDAAVLAIRGPPTPNSTATSHQGDSGTTLAAKVLQATQATQATVSQDAAASGVVAATPSSPDDTVGAHAQGD